MSLGALTVKIGADISDFQKKMSAVQRATNDLGKRMKDVGTTMSTALTLPILALGAVSVKSAASMDSLKRGLLAVAGSSTEAEAQLARLKEVAKLPGLGMEEAVRGSIALQAAGFQATMAERALKSFGNALATVGKGKAELDGVILALGQIQSKGKISAEEINQLAERVPQIRQIMLSAFGTADTEVLQKAKVSATDFVSRVVAELEKLPPVTGGVQNDFENLTDALGRAATAVGNVLIPVVTPLVEKIATLAERVADADSGMLRWGVAIVGATALIGPLVWVVGSLTAALSALAAALGTTLLPLIIAGGPIIIALTALSAVFIKLGLDSAAAAAEVEASAARMQAAVASMSDALLKQNRSMAAANLGTINQAIEQQVENIRMQARILEEAAPGRPRADAADLLSVMEANLETLKRQRDEMQAKADQFEAEAKRRAAASNSPKPDPITPTGKKGKTALELLDEEIDHLAKLAEMRALTADEQARMVSLEAQLNRQYQAGIPNLERRLEVLQQIEKLTAAMRVGVTENDRGMPTGAVTPGLMDRQRREMLRGLVNVEGEMPNSGPAGDGTGLGSDMGGRMVAVAENIVAAGDALKFAGQNVLSNFTPLGLASAALSGFFEAMQPVLDAVREPLRIVGEILASALIPVFRAVFPVFKLVAIAATYLGQIFFKVSEGIAKAVGALVYGLGVLIKAIPGDRGLGERIKSAGRGITALGEGFADSADAMAKGREELKGLEFDDAMDRAADGLNRLADSLLNVPTGFKVALARFNATSVGAPASAAATAATAVRGAAPVSIGDININGANKDKREIADEVVQEIRRRLAGAGNSDALWLRTALSEAV